MNKLKNFFSKKVNLVSTIIFVIILLIMIVVFLISIFRKDNKFALNPIYDVYPEEVRELYSNMVEVSCYGDLHLDISLDAGEFLLKDVKYNNLIDYMFSYLDKEEKLSDEFSVDVIKNATDRLFADEFDFTGYINDYIYGDYKYTIRNGLVTREKASCISNNNYISQLYGYSYNEQLLSVDVNIGYLKDNILYNLSNEELGKYDGKVESLDDLFITSSYYRYNYVLHDDGYKLKSVEWNVRY